MLGAGLLLISMPMAFQLPSPLALVAPTSRVPSAPCANADSGAAPTLREQMMAYLKSVQERGIELTAEQKAMIAEFQGDEELLEQRGCVDFMQGAQVLSPEEYEAQKAADGVPAANTASPSLHAVAAPAQPMAAPPVPQVVAAPAQRMAAPPTPQAVVGPGVSSTLDPATARLWLMQKSDREAAIKLLAQSAVGQGLSPEDSKELRRLLASLVATLTAA